MDLRVIVSAMFVCYFTFQFLCVLCVS